MTDARAAAMSRAGEIDEVVFGKGEPRGIDLLDTSPAVKECLTVGWQPIETAPKDGRIVLGFWPTMPGVQVHDACFGLTKYKHGGWFNAEDEDREYRDPEYWIPLPAAPRTQGDSNE